MKTIMHTFTSVTKQALLVLLLSAPGLAMAQDAAPLKVAMLDMAAALFNSDKAKEVDEQMRTENAEDEQKVRALAEQGTALQEKLQKDASVMSEAEVRKTNEEIQEINVQYQFLVQKIQTAVQERRQQFQETYAPSLIQAITAVQEEGQYDIIFRSEAALHYTASFDITARVTEKLNQQQAAAPAP